jgi:hypothetical protein
MYVIKDVCIHKVMKQSFCCIVALLMLNFFAEARSSEGNYTG